MVATAPAFTLATLRAWLLALARAGQTGDVLPAARRGVEALRRAGRLPVEPEHDAALAALAATDTAEDPDMPAAIESFLTALTPPSAGEGVADL